MSERSYPYEAWMVSRLGNLKKVTAVRCVCINWSPQWDMLESGRDIYIRDLHKSKEDAILSALSDCDEAKAKLEKSLANLAAKRKTLEAQL